MQPDVERARQELEHAREMSDRLWAEYRAYLKTLLPVRAEASPEAMRRMFEAGDWTRKIYEYEQALFMAENGTPAIVGSHGAYQWLTTVDYDLAGFLDSCPNVVPGKYLAVVGFDGSTLQLTEQGIRDGWSTAEDGKVFRGTSWGPPEYRDDWKVAYSPRLTSIHALPSQIQNDHGFHEWYIFEGPAPAGEMEAFVNWVGFRLYDPRFQWCADRFWEQMGRLRPESYIADGTIFTFATRNSALFAKVLEAFAADVK